MEDVDPFAQRGLGLRGFAERGRSEGFIVSSQVLCRINSCVSARNDASLDKVRLCRIGCPWRTSHPPNLERYFDFSMFVRVNEQRRTCLRGWISNQPCALIR